MPAVARADVLKVSARKECHKIALPLRGASLKRNREGVFRGVIEARNMYLLRIGIVYDTVGFNDKDRRLHNSRWEMPIPKMA